MTTGKLITFEGSEACGKSTQIEKLEHWLSQRRIPTLRLREPGGTALGEVVRDLLKHHPAGRGMAPETELLLFAASRAELVRHTILPALEKGTWILCDRFHDSTTVYQGHARGIDLPTVRSINALALGTLRPHLTLLLDLDTTAARSRLSRRPTPVGTPADRMESEPPEFYETVRQAYLSLAHEEPDRIRVIDSSGSQDNTFNLILTEIQNAFRSELD